MKIEVVGVWLGYEKKVDLRREGIGRFSKFMVKALLDKYPIQIEIWTLSINESAITRLFSEDCQTDLESGRLKIKTEVADGGLAAKSPSLAPPKQKKILTMFVLKYLKFMILKGWVGPSLFNFIVWLLNSLLAIATIAKQGAALAKTLLFNQKCPGDELARVANIHSQADVFWVGYAGLGSAAKLKAPMSVMTYDLMIFEFTEDFVRSRFGLVPILDEIREIVSFVNQVARRKGTFIGISWYVMNNQVRRYLPAIRPELADVVYIPVMINNSISPLASAVVRSKFRIEGPYVFYPTQIRPYKGVTDLLKAMQIINARGTEYKVVLTGQSLEGDSEAAHFIENNNLDKLVVLTGDVNEAELARLYLDATLVICPSHFEGGIHQPLLEAMHWGVPAVASRLPQTLERLDFHNTKENQSYLFQVGNIEELIETIEKVLADRDQTIATQRAIMDRLSDYDWAQAAEKMHSILTKTMTHKPQD